MQIKKNAFYVAEICNTQFSYPRVEAKHIYEAIYEKAEFWEHCIYFGKRRAVMGVVLEKR